MPDDITKDNWAQTSGEFRVVDMHLHQHDITIADHEDRMRRLERAYWKMIGMAGTLAALGGYLGAFLGK